MDKNKGADTSIVKVETDIVPSTNSYGLPDITEMEVFVDSIMTSSLAKSFEKVNPKTKVKEVNRGDIISSIILAKDMGIGIGGALVLGKQLDANSYYSALKGKAMGMDAISSINNIHTFEAGGKKVQSIGINAINMVLMRSNVKVTVLRDYLPTVQYREAYTNAYVGHHWQLFPAGRESSVFVFNDKIHKKEDVQAAKDAGKIIVVRDPNFTYVTTIEFYRKSNDMTLTISYSLQEAIDAELHVGYHSTLLDAKSNPFYIKGKSNWNNHPSTLLRNRPISIGARIIVGDGLQGIYSNDEVLDMMNVEHNTDYSTIEEVKEATIVNQ